MRVLELAQILGQPCEFQIEGVGEGGYGLREVAPGALPGHSRAVHRLELEADFTPDEGAGASHSPGHGLERWRCSPGH
jgi:hypothetical protein